MEKISTKTTSLISDIEQIIKQCPGKSLNIIQFCQDHKNPYLYIDRKPVFDISQDEMLGIFDMKYHHLFLRMDQITRFAGFMRLKLSNTLALILKAEWEYLVADIAGYFTSSEINLEAVLTDDEFLDKIIPYFRPGTDKILKHVKNVKFSEEEKLSFGYIDMMLNELISKRVYLLENGAINQFFSERSVSERMLLFGASEQQVEKYHNLKDLWYLKSSELDDFLLLLEKKKRMTLNLEDRFMRTFGKEVIEKNKLTYSLKKYNIILGLIEKHPDFSLRKLIKLADEDLIKEQKDNSDMKQKYWRSFNYVDTSSPGVSSTQISDNFKKEYIKKCKDLLKKIYFLLHSDTCPYYRSLSKSKKKKVNELWLELMESTSKDEMYSFSQAMLLYSLPDYEVLLSIYNRACEILEIDPASYEIGNRLDFMISKGSNFEEVISFLSNELLQLELHMANLELAQDEYTRERDAQTYRNALRDSQGFSEKLKAEITEITNVIRELKEDIIKKYKLMKNGKKV